MGDIKRLPEALRSTVRSGVVLFDLTRVVEELVFNCLDAGAKKVSVYVSVGTCYVKVEDDGFGICREGLVLLGERYVTSKLQHLADMDAVSGTFGFRGEALASISDVSVLEVITKAHGRPNGYRKVMKGSKCLFLGIDDDRKDVGTTVTVRDLFYNQPVRRKCMQSSPKKVLHAVKKSVIRIALVQSKVSFKVVDIESEVELFSSQPSSSPLSLLMSGFGFKDSSFLHELDMHDGLFKMSGYISNPCSNFTVKAFQYIYINSRYICKGPIHKLMNQLAACFEFPDSWKGDNESRKGKRNRSEACPAYILNLCCPQSFYDLIFEPSKTDVVFKDWNPVLTFIERAVQTVWTKNKTSGASFDIEADMVHNEEIHKKGDSGISAGDLLYADLSEKANFCQYQFGNHQASPPILGSPLEETARKDNDWFIGEFIGECERTTLNEFKKDPKKVKWETNDMHFQTEDSFQPLSGLITEHSLNVPWKSDNYMHFQTEDSFQPLSSSITERSPNVPRKSNIWPYNNNISLEGSYYLNKRFFDAERSICLEGDVINSQMQNEYIEMEDGIGQKSSGTDIFDADDLSNELNLSKDMNQPFLRSCSSQGSIPFEKPLFVGEEGFKSIKDCVKTKRKKSLVDERVDILNIEVNNQSSNMFPRRTMSLDEASHTRHSLRSRKKWDSSSDLCLPSSYAEPFSEKNTLFDSDALVSPNLQSWDSEWQHEALDTLFVVEPRGVSHFTDRCTLEGNFGSTGQSYLRQLANVEENNKCGYDVKRKSTEKDICSSSCSYPGLGVGDDDSFSRDLLKWENSPKAIAPNRFGNLANERKGICSASCSYSGLGNRSSERKRKKVRFKDYEKCPTPKKSFRRSHSAPPFHREKTRFISLSHSAAAISAQKPIGHQNSLPSAVFADARSLKHLQQTSDLCKPSGHHNALPSASDDASSSKHPKQTSDLCHPKLKLNPIEDSLLDTSCRLDTNKSNTSVDLKKPIQPENLEQSKCPEAQYIAHVEDFMSRQNHNSVDCLTKWRSNPQTTKNDRSCDKLSQDNILDISSGLLHLAGDSLIPESINKNCLEDAKVLQQVDKKFIAVVAGGTLAVIDQHAADERIRLEELRRKVLSGEAKKITYLDAEQELVLPEIGFQLLHSYAEQIQDWGWICNIHNQSSDSFRKSLKLFNRKAATIKLLAVPCVLGVNLSDVDLLEFLQQLADTNGSSTMPPSVLRVLNSKACRGAIMFGDSLLHSECSLIVEELKQTSLCFQCAHGRPTTVPLVKLEALHKQISQLGMLNNHTSQLWHGFQRHEPSLARAKARLSAAKG